MDVWTVRGAAAAAALLLAAAAAAQGALPAPPSHVEEEGTAGTDVPFGRRAPARVQYVYDAMLFSGPVTITGVQLRLDGGAVADAKTVDCEIALSTLPRPLVELSPRFALNRGADEVAVLPRRLVELPSQASASVPNPFLAPISFDAPFAYDPRQGGLVMELVVHGQPPGAYLLDVSYLCTSPTAAVGPAPCRQSNGLPHCTPTVPLSTPPPTRWGSSRARRRRSRSAAGSRSAGSGPRASRRRPARWSSGSPRSCSSRRSDQAAAGAGGNGRSTRP